MIKPLGDRVVIEVSEGDVKTASGIVLPDTAKEKPQKGTVVAVGAGEYKDGIVRQLEAVEGVHDFSDCPVELQDHVATGSQTALSGKAGMWYTRYVYVLCTHI